MEKSITNFNLQKLIVNKKLIHDNIHNYIQISNYAHIIIDTPYFQRLRYLNQLATCQFAFPNATHTRFEHSIGTYYLTGRILDCICKTSDMKSLNKWLSDIPELKEYYKDKDINTKYLDDYICELVKIAGLCHDLGHGPFSHTFDDVFIKSCNTQPRCEDTHENRSGLLVEKIIRSTELSNIICDEHIQFIQVLIDPPLSRQGFIYQIISNNLNGLDIDKFDYIARDTYSVGLKYSFDFYRLVDDVKVINNIITYPQQTYYEICCLFMTRYRLHKQICCHKTVIAVEYMINDIMILLDPILQINNSVTDMDKFVDLTDGYILSSVKFLNKNKPFEYTDNIEKAVNIMNRIETRKFYKYVGTIVTKKKLNINNEIILDIDNTINTDELLIYERKIGFVSGDKSNPLDNVYFYNKKDDNVNFMIQKDQITNFIPDIYQEHIIMFFIKNYQENDILKLEQTIKKLKELLI